MKFSLTVRTLYCWQFNQQFSRQLAFQQISHIDDDLKWFLIKFGTLIKIILFYPSFCFNWIHTHKHEIALSAHKPCFLRGKTVMTAAAETQILLYHQHLYFTLIISWLLNSRRCATVGEVTTNAKIFVVASNFLLG